MDTPNKQMGKNTRESNANMQLRSSSDGSVAIYWDIENCSVPRDVRPEDVAGNIIAALQKHPGIGGAIVKFYAFGDINRFRRELRAALFETGVKFIDVPNGRKDAADNAIIADMILSAHDMPSLSTFMVISGDVDFAPLLLKFRKRGYTIILVIPSGVDVSSALRNAGKFVCEWQSMVRSGALVSPRVGSVGDWRRCPINDNSDVKSGDLNVLKGQLVKLLERSGGSLRLDKIAEKYDKSYNGPLRVSEYGEKNLSNLFKQMKDTMTVKVEGYDQFVHLKNWKAGPSAPPLSLAKEDKKGKGGQEKNANAVTGRCPSDEFPDEDRLGIEEPDESVVQLISPVMGCVLSSFNSYCREELSENAGSGLIWDRSLPMMEKSY